MKAWKICRVIFIAMLVSILICGCWDVRIINQRSYVTMVGIDLTQQGMFRVFAQVVVPRKLVGGGQGGGGEEKTFAVLSAEGSTILEALRNMETVESRHIDFGHIRAYIFTEKLARAGMLPLIDLFMRYPQFPKDSWVLVTREDIGQIMEKKHYSEQMPSVYVDVYMRGSGQLTAQSIPVQLWEFHRNLTNAGMNAFAPTFILKRDVGEAADVPKPGKTPDEDKEANLQIRDTALFKRGVLVGYLNSRETQFLNWFLNKRNLGTFTVEDPRIPGRNQTVTLQKVDLKIKPYFSQDRQISFKIDAKIIAFIDETLGLKIPETPEMSALEQNVQRNLERELQHFMTKLHHDLQVDPIGLGYKFRRQYPEIWSKLNWYEAWPQSTVSIEVKLELRSRGELQ